MHRPSTALLPLLLWAKPSRSILGEIHGRGTRSGLFDTGDPCGRAARPGDRRARHADLPDHLLRLRRRRARRLAVRAEILRQHLHAHRQPDAGGAGGAHRGAGRRHGGARRRLRPRGAAHRVPHADAARRRDRRGKAALWRLHQPARPLDQEFRLEGRLGRHRRPLHLRGGGLAAHQGDLHRVDRQSRRHRHRHRGDRQDRPSRRRAAHRRQHAGDARTSAAPSSTAPTSSCIR